VLAGDEGDELRTVEYGTLLDVTPVVTSDGRITLALRVGVTGFEGELENIAGIQLTSRDLETTVTTADGQALVLGGLLERAVEVRESGVPILKDIPLLGFLFRTTSTTDRHGDLLVVVTAEITPNESDTASASAP
jgi:type II secretory pathway component GspD/PulD (secretin)